MVCPTKSDVARWDARHHRRMKHKTTAARLDVLEAAVLALAEALPNEDAAATRAGFLQRIEDLPELLAPAADADADEDAARTLAALLTELLR